jgi:tRNA(Ile2) C34 agmatinyltransferase TiaS
MTLLIIGILILLALWAGWNKPLCPKCGSDDIGVFDHHGKKVFTCHECGHRDNENKL